jgi:hypothetical protein
MVGFGSVYLAPQISNAERAQEFEQHAHRLGLMNVVGAICSYAMTNRRSEEINFLCDSQRGWEGGMTEMWDSVVRGSNVWYPGELSRLRFGDSKEVPPLQAADLFAYEIRKDVKDRIERPQSPRSMALHRLLRGILIWVSTWTRLSYRSGSRHGKTTNRFPALLCYSILARCRWSGIPLWSFCKIRVRPDSQREIDHVDQR